MGYSEDFTWLHLLLHWRRVDSCEFEPSLLFGNNLYLK